MQVSPPGKGILVTGCEESIAWNLAKKLDDLGFTVFAGFTKVSACEEAEVLREEGSGRMKVLQLDVTSETQVFTTNCARATKEKYFRSESEAKAKRIIRE